ncbi:MAG: hypothetical protein WCK76_04980 [Elusimicrobiota bacterium]
MRSLPVKTLAAALVLVLPALSRAQADLADKIFSGGYSGLLKVETPAVPEPPVPQSPFVFDPVVNQRLAEKLGIPVFFALPDSAYAGTSGGIAPMGGLLDFRHPAAAGAPSPVGLRVYLTPRDKAAERLGASGLVQTGDILLTFRPEWGFEGPYPNIQMGISHAGLAFVENGVVSNIDNPLSREYIGSLDAKHYNEAAALHIIRPRDLSAQQKENLLGWAKKLTAAAPDIYPAQLSFNQDYFKPKYTPDLKFVAALARIALRQDKAAKLDLYCSEFVWAVLALRNCDPADAAAFAGEGTPACVKPVFNPLPMLGDYFLDPKAPAARLGLSDGPLAVIDSMGLPEAQKQVFIGQVFEKKRVLSPGHAAVAASLAPFFMKMEGYYSGIQTRDPKALAIRDSFNGNVKPNYSPTSYLINALLPAGNEERKMDAVATVVFLD